MTAPGRRGNEIEDNVEAAGPFREEVAANATTARLSRGVHPIPAGEEKPVSPRARRQKVLTRRAGRLPGQTCKQGHAGGGITEAEFENQREGSVPEISTLFGMSF